MKLGRWSFAAPVVVLLAAVVVAVLLRPEKLPAGTLQTSTLTAPRVPGPCERGAREPFTPKTMDIENVRKDLPIVALARDGNDVPGVPPVSATHTVAWDAPGPKPGSSSGLVRFNAHTWPNNGALGNELLAHFQIGDILIVADGDTKLCYRVTDRVEVDGYSTYDRFFELGVPSEFALIVCSGKRVGPGNWTTRTVWFGTPYYGNRRI